MSEEDRTICFCHNVPLSAIRAVIRRGSVTLGAIQADTLASTGCGGCECDVVEILREELAAAGKVPASPGKPPAPAGR